MTQNDDTKTTAPTTAPTASVNVLTDAAEAVKNATGDVRARLVTTLVQRELDSRVDVLDKALTKLKDAKKEFQKLKPDQVALSADGTKSETYSEAKWKERAKAQEELAKLEKAVESALVDGSFDKLRELVKY